MTSVTREQPSERRWVVPHRSPLRRLAELVALNAAVAQPLLWVFADSTETIIAAGAGAADVVLFALLVTLGPAVGLFAIESAIGLIHRRSGDVAHVVALALLMLFFASEALAISTDLAGTAFWALGSLLGAAALGLWFLFEAVRRWLSLMSLAAVAFLGLFLFASPVSQLLRPTSASPISTASSDTPVVFVVFDELPTTSLLDGKGGIDGDLFPNFARLASDSTWYRNNASVADGTTWAMPAILTGRYPAGREVAAVPANYSKNLFTLLAGSHQIIASEALPLCPSNICDRVDPPGSPIAELLGKSVDVFSKLVAPDPPLEESGFPSLDATTQTVRFEDFLTTIDDPEQDATLWYIHDLLPHAPFQLLPNGRTYADPPTPFGMAASPYFSWSDQNAADLARQRHILQTIAVDALLGELLDRLEAEGLYDDALIVLTADHGISFDSRQPVRRAVPETLDEMAWVPLFIKAPDQQVGQVDDRNAMTIDILPTVADQLGVDIPWSVDGISLLGPERPDNTKRYYYWNRPIEDGEVVDPDGELAGHDFVEDYDGDPSWTSVRSGRWWPDRVDDPAARTRMGPWATGVYDDLIGRRVADLAVGEPTQLQAGLELPDRDVPDDEGTLPAMITGRLTEPDLADEDLILAVAVDGTIAAFSPIFDSVEEPGWFGAMIDPSLRNPGPLDITLYAVIDTEDGQQELRAVQLT